MAHKTISSSSKGSSAMARGGKRGRPHIILPFVLSAQQKSATGGGLGTQNPENLPNLEALASESNQTVAHGDRTPILNQSSPSGTVNNWSEDAARDLDLNDIEIAQVSSYATSNKPDEGNTLKFVPGIIVNSVACAKIEKLDIHSEIDYWSTSVLRCVLGAKPPFCYD